jgi:hypothetical protein
MKRIALTLSLVAFTAPAATAALASGASSPSPVARAAAIVKMWRANLHSRALADPKQHFPNLSDAMLTSRLRLAARRYHFTVVKVEILRPRQAAPLVVIQAKDKQALSSSTNAILRLVDPKAKTNDDLTGWAYEGFLLEARGSDGAPFLITFNWWRSLNGGGGQWAADPTLYPFPHG